ncbi:DNA primase, partial [Microbacterium sp. HSID17254]|uniref:bifunctional DNA primase/polymerase n=1 Tax=Microbacterium sp. HSID17254 TaxID=2419509 RepID=UPI000F930A6F
MLEVALGAARAGYHVFPLQVDGKKPIFHAKRTCKRSGPCSGPEGHLGWEQRATIDPEQIRRWCSAKPYNVGMACGPSNLLVIDLDEGRGATAPEEVEGARNGRDVLRMLERRAGEPVPDQTLTVSTPSGGGHLYFRNDIALRNSSQTGLGWKIATRGEGGHILAPGSVRPEGRYQFQRFGPPADLPPWTRAILAPPPQPATAHVPRRS